jgi:hypothetical protein
MFRFIGPLLVQIQKHSSGTFNDCAHNMGSHIVCTIVEWPDDGSNEPTHFAEFLVWLTICLMTYSNFYTYYPCVFVYLVTKNP